MKRVVVVVVALAEPGADYVPGEGGIQRGSTVAP